MNILNISAILITVSALFSFINYRFIKLPTAIGLMLISLVVSLLLLGAGKLGWGQLETQARVLLDSIDFNETLMQGMLSFLLFAGALHINLDDLAKQKWVISSLATVGILTSTFLVGGITYYLLDFLGLHLDFIYCLLFGSLISPTDPIAVLGILKSANAPKTLETKIAGESLFNDGVAVVVFIVLLGIATGSTEATVGHVALLFVEEAVGGVAFGFAIGWVTYQMLKQVDNYQVEILLTLALVMGGYALASAIHTSGPIAVVVAGLLIGNQGRMLAMSENSRKHLDTFWELIDEILNAVLFVLIGLEVLVLPFTQDVLLASLALIPLVLAARFISVGIPISLLRLRREFTPGAIKILTWGGLRGGVSVALALSLPASAERDIIVAITYTIVIFSIVVQGLTIGRLVKSVT
ncbi:MAG: sodium:proton antiporter [Ectothiorhodospiraceae bacterium]|nr:sodium:proton antiporter [Ectothiorhodospiraceae bacterium]